MFKTVKARLFTSQALLIALLWAVVATGVVSIRHLNDVVDDLITDNIAVFEILAQMKEANLFNRIYWREAIHAGEAARFGVELSFASTASMQKAMAQQETMSSLMQRLKDKAPQLDSEDQAAIRQLDNGMAAFLATSPALEGAVRNSGDVSSAGRTMAAARDQSLLPALQAYFHHKQEEVTHAEATAESVKAEGIRWLIIVAGLASAIAASVAIILSRSIAGPLGESRRVSGLMAAGDFRNAADCRDSCAFGRTIGCQGNECEVGQVNLALSTMRESLSAAISTIQLRANEAHGHSGALANSMGVALTASQAQAENVMRVSAATEELNVSIAEVASTIRQVVSSSQSSSSYAQQGVSLVERNRAAMDSILSTAHTSSQAIAELQQATVGIQSLTTQIREIADQTNLLALNAAIEAARAGESGRGFAVVADEVRKLAEKTGATSASIQELAEGMHSKVDGATRAINQIETSAHAGTALAGETSSALQRIVAETQIVERQIQGINDGASEQKAAADSTAQAMEEIASLTEENDAAMEQINATAQELKLLADSLALSVDGFQVGDSRRANQKTVRR